MSDQPINRWTDGLRAQALQIQCACFDVDGTLTDGRLWIDHQGRESKAFHVHDGLGLRALMAAGVRVAWITARQSACTLHRAQELGIPVYMGMDNKHLTLLTLAQEWNISLEHTLFMGDDLPDLPALQAVGLPTAPANAHPSLKPYVRWQSMAMGGNGAVREVCDLVLEAQNKHALLRDRLGQ